MLAAKIIGDLGTISVGLIYICFAVGTWPTDRGVRCVGAVGCVGVGVQRLRGGAGEWMTGRVCVRAR
jgi:hypothetical protein